MATSLTANGVIYPNGGTQSIGAKTIIGWAYNEYSTRTGSTFSSSPTPTNLWYAHAYTRKRSDSGFRVNGILPGHNRYSYPYWGLGLRFYRPSGGYIDWMGYSNSYQPCPENESAEVIWWCDSYIPAATLGTETGQWNVYYVQGSFSGTSTDGFAEIWNPNSSDDARGYQQGSTSMLYEEVVA